MPIPRSCAPGRSVQPPIRQIPPLCARAATTHPADSTPLRGSSDQPSGGLHPSAPVQLPPIRRISPLCASAATPMQTCIDPSARLCRLSVNGDKPRASKSGTRSSPPRSQVALRGAARGGEALRQRSSRHHRTTRLLVLASAHSRSRASLISQPVL